MDEIQRFDLIFSLLSLGCALFVSIRLSSAAGFPLGLVGFIGALLASSWMFSACLKIYIFICNSIETERSGWKVEQLEYQRMRSRKKRLWK